MIQQESMEDGFAEVLPVSMSSWQIHPIYINDQRIIFILIY